MLVTIACIRVMHGRGKLTFTQDSIISVPIAYNLSANNAGYVNKSRFSLFTIVLFIQSGLQIPRSWVVPFRIRLLPGPSPSPSRQASQSP